MREDCLLRTSQGRRIGACFALVFGVSLSLTGCGASAGQMTCSEFEQLDYNEQASTLTDLLDEHDLDPYNSGNIVGVTSSVSSFCAMTSNTNSRIDEAVDWESSTW